MGVCLATSGPGAMHLLNGLYDAKLDHQPVVAIIGQQARSSLGANYQQEVDLDALYKDVASEFVQVCMVPAQARHLVDRAMRIAQASRTVTCIIVPNDVQEEPYEDPPREHGSVFSSPGWDPPRIVPTQDALARAAELLNAGEKVAMLIGAGAKRAQPEVMQVAELLGAGVAKALNGRAALPDELPYVTGSIGLLGTKPSADMMDDCDTLLMVGTSFPYSEWLPKEGQARAVQIDIDGRLVGMRYPTEVNLVGDAAETLRALVAAAAAQGRPLLARGDRGQRAPLVGHPRRRGRTRAAEPDQPPAASSTSCPGGCPTASSSPRTPARRPTGGRGTCSCGRA